MVATYVAIDWLIMHLLVILVKINTMLISAHRLFRDTPSPGAVVAFNVITLEHAEAIVQAAEMTRRPVILQLSENAIVFRRSPRAIASAMAAIAEDAGTGVALHLDHITDVSLARTAHDLGFSSVMFDAATSAFDARHRRVGEGRRGVG